MKAFLAILLTLLVSVGCACFQMQEQQVDVENLRNYILPVRRHVESSVFIQLNLYGSAVPFGRQGKKVLAFTAKHIVGESEDLSFLTKVGFPIDVDESFVKIKSQEYPVEVLYQDEKIDIAVIRFEPQNKISIPELDSRQMKIGDEVLLVGSTSELNKIIVSAMVAGKCTQVTKCNFMGDTPDNFILDTPVYPGMSGGPVFKNGKLAGIITATLFSKYSTNKGIFIEPSYSGIIGNKILVKLKKQFNPE
jgi:S1-C subfamily serine protease